LSRTGRAASRRGIDRVIKIDNAPEARLEALTPGLKILGAPDCAWRLSLVFLSAFGSQRKVIANTMSSQSSRAARASQSNSFPLDPGTCDILTHHPIAWTDHSPQALRRQWIP
jgi:hypothetical protein